MVVTFRLFKYQSVIKEECPQLGDFYSYLLLELDTISLQFLATYYLPLPQNHRS